MGDRTQPAERALLTGEGADRDALAETLSSDVDVVRAAEFAGALASLRETTFACVILGDGDRPVADRVDRLRRDGYDVPVVALAADALPETTDVAAVAPADDPAAAAVRVEAVVADRRLDRRLAARRRLRTAARDARTAALAAHAFEDAAGAACEALVAAGAYRVAWVGRRDPSTQRVTPVAAAGLPLAHLSSRVVDGGATAAALETGAVASADPDDGGWPVAAAPVAVSPPAVFHVAGGEPWRDSGAVTETERTALASLADALAERFAGEARATAPDAVRVLGDTFGHELGNQLDVATAHLELARERDDDDHYARVETALDRMADLATESRLLAAGDLAPESVSLASATRSAWERVDADGATLHVTDARVEADPDLLELLLENLLRNSVDHGSAGRKNAERSGDAVERGASSPRSQAREDADDPGGEGVTVRAGPTDDGFAVADDGPGVPPDERAAVFEWGRSATGSGVGLGVVALVAERHGWSVEMRESRAGGARVEISCS